MWQQRSPRHGAIRLGALSPIVMILLLIALPAGAVTAWRELPFPGAGIRLGEQTVRGFYTIRGIRPGSPADVAGLASGDVVVGADATAVMGRSREEILAALDKEIASGWSVLLSYVRDGAERVAWVRPLHRTEAQRRVLYVRSLLLEHRNRAQQAYADGLDALHGHLVGTPLGRHCREQLAEARDRLWKEERAILEIPLPEALPGGTAATLADAVGRMGEALATERQALSFLRPLIGPQSGPADLDADWRHRFERLHQGAMQLEARAMGGLLQALRAVSLSETALQQFLDAETLPAPEELTRKARTLLMAVPSGEGTYPWVPAERRDGGT
ncbi:MAG: hypothetical protein K9L28_08290 [Synergistales bacterium]|nr:hypothetical protein [Synergistales bacterium]